MTDLEDANKRLHALGTVMADLNRELKIYKARYEELQNRYLNGNEKYFGELCGLYFEDEKYPKEKKE